MVKIIGFAHVVMFGILFILLGSALLVKELGSILNAPVQVFQEGVVYLVNTTIGT
jgi:hypothetical protein